MGISETLKISGFAQFSGGVSDHLGSAIYPKEQPAILSKKLL